jgi:DNA polymerase III subunit delta
MTQQDLQRHIVKRQFVPVYLFHGKEEFIMERTARALALAALGDGDASFNYHVFWGTEAKAADVVNAANAFPFLSEQRVVLVRDANPILKDAVLIHYVQNPNPSTVLILTASTPARKSRAASAKAAASDIFLYLQSRTNAVGQDVTVEFKELRDAAMVEWIIAEFERHGRHIARQAAIMLQDLKGNVTGEIATEVEKIVTALPDAATIEVAQVEALLNETRQFDVFELTQAVFARNAAEAQDIVQRILASEGSGATGRIIFQLARDLSILWQARSLPSSGRSTDEEARMLGVASGWQLDKIRAHVPKFRGGEYFDRCFAYLLEADAALKTGASKNPGVVLSTLIHRLTASDAG